MHLEGSQVQHFLDILVLELLSSSPDLFSILFSKEWVHILDDYDHLYTSVPKNEEKVKEERSMDSNNFSCEGYLEITASIYEGFLNPNFVDQIYQTRLEEVHGDDEHDKEATLHDDNLEDGSSPISLELEELLDPNYE